MTNIAERTIVDAVDSLSRGELSAEQLVTDTLDQIARTEPYVHAYVAVCEETSLAAARAIDHGVHERERPLQGIPFGIKDVLSTADAPTTAGAITRADRGIGRDATAVERLRNAGAIMIGKHVTHEFACGFDEPPARNAWDVECYPGGSTAGGGVSVAVGSCFVALGTDAGGSVRIPASVNGVVGLKPTFGRISTYGTVSGATIPSVEHVGLLTRTVSDAALVLGVVSGCDPRDARTMYEENASRDFGGELTRGVEGLRLGRLRDDALGPPPDPDVLERVTAAYDVLAAAGADLVDVSLNALSLATPAASVVITAEMAARHRLALSRSPQDYGSETRRLLQAGQLASVARLEDARMVQADLRLRLQALYAESRLDAIVTPTLACVPMPLSDLEPSRDMPRLIQYTCPWSLVGQPAISVPCGFTSRELPIGLQIVGAPLHEARILRIAKAYEDRTRWHLRRPALANHGGMS